MKTTPEQTDAEFFALVNLAPAKLQSWLETEESHSVGWRSEHAESVGHRSGRRIVNILRKKRDELTEGDRRHMRKVIGFIKRHRAQTPKKEDVAHSRWRASLMNWGHDPLKH